MSGLSETEIATYKAIFDHWDGNRDGVIQKDEIGTVLRAAGQNPTEAEIDEFMARADTNENGVVDFDEFICMVDEVKKTTPSDVLLREAFKVS